MSRSPPGPALTNYPPSQSTAPRETLRVLLESWAGLKTSWLVHSVLRPPAGPFLI